VHLSELHGAATHLVVVAVPVYALVVLQRRLRGEHPVLRQLEPWLLGAGLAGVAAAGATGLLVWGEAQTTLRGQVFRLGTAHFWLGIALAAVLLLAAAVRWGRPVRGRSTRSAVPIAVALLAVAAVAVQGFLGGRMTYDAGVGVAAGGQLAQSAAGAARLDAALARGADAATAGRAAFSDSGLGCARCHGDVAEGARGPRLAGGVELQDFRRVHRSGLFPAQIVTDRDFRAIDAWLRTVR
jgi:uncharacterized membrane protein